MVLFSKEREREREEETFSLSTSPTPLFFLSLFVETHFIIHRLCRRRKHIIIIWRLDSARKGRKGGATRSGKGFRRLVRFLVGALRVYLLLFPDTQRSRMASRIESNLSLERGERFSSFIFFFGLWGHFRFGVREETIFSSSSFSSGDGLSATPSKTKRDGNNARESSRRIDFYYCTHHAFALLLFQILLQKLHLYFHQKRRRQRKQCMSTAEDPSECKDVREDYLECLHHKKEFQRANAIQAEADRQRGEEAAKIWAKIEKHVNDTSWGEVKKEGEGEKAS